MFHYGYHIGVLNAPVAYMFPEKTMGQWAIAVSIFCLGGVLGASVAGGFADKYGRSRMLLLFGGGVGLMASLVSAIAPTVHWFWIARTLVGVSGGAATVLTPLYLSEVAVLRPESKGTLGTLTQLATVLGILVSAMIGIPLSHDWRWLFWIMVVMNGCMIALVPCCLPESPQWLLLQHYVERGQEAKRILDRWYSFSSTNITADTDADDESLNNEQINQCIQRHIMNGSEEVADSNANENESEEEPTYSFASYYQSHRIPVLSVFVYVMTQQLSGINAVFYYSTSFLQGVIDDAQTITLLCFAVNAVSVLPPVYYMDRFGRKTWLLTSLTGMAVCAAGLTVGRVAAISSVTILSLFGYIISFELGLGCIPFFLASDLIQAEYIAQIQSWAMALNWISNFGIGIGFPYLDHALGEYSFAPFFGALVVALLYTIWILPEISTTTHNAAAVVEDEEDMVLSSNDNGTMT